MDTLHLAPGLSAAGSLRQAFREASLGEEIATLPDDLSCGPIRCVDASGRIAWWRQTRDGMEEMEPIITSFWNRVMETGKRIVVWAGQRSACEHAFLLAVAHALGDREVWIIDAPQPDCVVAGSPALDPSAVVCISLLAPSSLRGLIGTERAVLPEERVRMRERWRALQAEDAPFRVVAGDGLVSVAADYFDADLLAEVSARPTKVARVVAAVLSGERGWIQVGDMMLVARLAALVKAGKLVADGDPMDVQRCFVRLPN